MNDLERIALVFYFGTQEYTNAVVASGRNLELGQYDVDELARTVNQDWVNFENLVQSYFGLSPTLNDTLVSLNVDHVTFRGELFYVGFV